MKSWEDVVSDVESGPRGLFKWIAIGIVAITLLFGGLRWLIMPADKAIERAVLKQSFQYKEGMAQRGAILEANLAEIDARIATETDPGTLANLERQRTIIRAQLRAITINK